MSYAKLAGTFTADATSGSIALHGKANISLSGTFGGGTVSVQRSFDSGTSWVTVSRDSAGTAAAYTAAADVILEEPEKGVLYRLSLAGSTGPSLAYRISQ